MVVGMEDEMEGVTTSDVVDHAFDAQRAGDRPVALCADEPEHR